MQWMLLYQDPPEDFAIATGVHSVRQLVEFASAEIGVAVAFEGTNEIARVIEVEGEVGDITVKVDAGYFLSTEVETRLGDPTEAKKRLGWISKITLSQLVTEMIKADYTDAKRKSLVKQAGFHAFDQSSWIARDQCLASRVLIRGATMMSSSKCGVPIPAQ